MIISIASGKGGTGKTTVAVNLALAIENGIQLLDCDAEEPNAHIFIRPKISEKKSVFVPMPEVDREKCNLCGKCAKICAYNAIAVVKDKLLIFPELCHGCGACSYLCPQKAIREVNKEIGYLEIGNKNELDFVHGKLNIGEILVTFIIKEIKKHKNQNKTVIIDCPPGTSCPMITAVKDSDYCILVTEPTPFGLNDLILAVEVLRKLDIPFGVFINRSDLGNENVENYCQKENIRILAKIPFSKEIAVAYSKGITIVDSIPSYKRFFQEMFDSIVAGKS
ncbi:MAG: (4Fe-4S)-binding protein [Coxiella sp. DG_40]|nr:MAG: (4Fe-4S)-binding protein [Coxiella sp. DG_40]